MQVLGSKAQGARRERMEASPRFKDGMFHNTSLVTQGLKKGTAVSTMKEFICGGQRRVPIGVLPIVNPLEQWLLPVQSGLRATSPPHHHDGTGAGGGGDGTLRLTNQREARDSTTGR